MPFAVFNAQGQIVSLHRHDPGVGEEVAADDPAVRHFLGLAEDGLALGGFDAAEPAGGFDQLDAEFIRVLEDVIDALTARNLINITDLPDIAQSKLFARRSFRERRPHHALDLFRVDGQDTVI